MALATLKVSKTAGGKEDFEHTFERLAYFVVPNTVASKRIFDVFSNIFDITTHNIKPSCGTIELSIEGMLGGSNKLTVIRDLKKPNDVEVQENKTGRSLKFKTFHERTLSAGIVVPHISMINPTHITNLTKLNPEGLWEFLRNQILLVSDFTKLRADIHKQNRDDYAYELLIEHHKTETAEVVSNIERRLKLLSLGKEAEKDLKELRNVRDYLLRKNLLAKVNEISTHIQEATETIQKCDTEIERLQNNHHVNEFQVEAFEVVIEMYNSASNILEDLTFEVPNYEAELLKSTEFEKLDIESAWREFLKFSNESAKIKADQDQLQADIQFMRSKINFLNLFENQDDAYEYLENCERTMQLLSSSDGPLKDGIDVNNLLNHKTSNEAFYQWKKEIDKAATNTQRLGTKFEELCAIITNETHRNAQLKIEIELEKATSNMMASRLHLSRECLDGLVELEKLQRTCKDKQMFRGNIKPMYKYMELADKPNPMLTDFSFVLSLIVVKNTETANYLLQKLPNNFEYTFLITKSFHSDCPAIIKRSQHRYLEYPIKFLAPGTHKENMFLIDSLMANKAVASGDWPIEKLLDLQKALAFIVVNEDGDRITESTISGGYTPQSERQMKACDIAAYVDGKLKMQEKEQRFLEIRAKVSEAANELQEIKLEMQYLMFDFYLPIHMPSLHSAWDSILQAKLNETVTPNKIQLQSIQRLVDFIQNAIEDQENQELETVDEIYDAIKTSERILKLKSETLAATQISEKNALTQLIKVLVDLKHIELSFGITASLPVAQYHETFWNNVKTCIDKVNKAITESRDSLIDNTEHYKSQQQMLMASTDLTIEGLSEDRQNLAVFRAHQIKILEPLQEELEKYPDLPAPNTTHTEIHTVVDEYRQYIEHFRQAGIPYPANFSTFKEKTILTKIQRQNMCEAPIYSQFLDNISLLFPKMHMRSLRQIHAAFSLFVKKLDLEAELKFTWKSPDPYIENITSIELCGRNVGKGYLIVILLLSIAFVFRPPFVVLHEVFDFIPLPQQMKFKSLLRDLVNYIQVVCIDQQLRNLVGSEISEVLKNTN